MNEKQPSVRFSHIGAALHAEITGEIDHHTAKHIREEIDGQIYAARPKEITLSLAKVGFMDSSGLGLIVGRLVTAKEVGGSLTLTGVDKRTMRIFTMAGLERMRGLTIKPSEEKR
jgi:stage II sporulation protein AA (anti-sigma F factor antagonist)